MPDDRELKEQSLWMQRQLHTHVPVLPDNNGHFPMFCGMVHCLVMSG